MQWAVVTIYGPAHLHNMHLVRNYFYLQRLAGKVAANVNFAHDGRLGWRNKRYN
jgi:hypothetical protein